MYKTNIEYLRNQITRAIAQEGSPYSTFRIDFDAAEKVAPKTNFDEIMSRWVLHKKLMNLSLNEVCNLLITPHNEMPLWIKLQKNEEEKYYQLYISKRFRKLKVIKEWHNDNEFMPIIK